jgi:CRISPR/Cas system-associated endonuclease Cas3-HD
MSTLEKTIVLLNKLPEKQLEIIYSYVQYVSSQQTENKGVDVGELDEVFNKLVGALPDTGKTLDEYRDERIKELYETIN